MNQNEKLYKIPDAYELASGIRPHISTCHRHRLQGIHGVRLETVKCGGRRMTSVEAVQRFMTSVTAASDSSKISPQTPRQRQASISAAERALDQEGI